MSRAYDRKFKFVFARHGICGCGWVKDDEIMYELFHGSGVGLNEDIPALGKQAAES